MATKRKPRITVNTPYTGPYGTPLAHVHYQEGRHLQPERIPFHRPETPVSLRLLDVSKESLENVRRVAGSIKRLLAPSLKLKTVPESLVAYLEHLERLDLGHNSLTDASFPDAMKSLDLLVELRLNDNQLTRIPACLRRMRSLCRLDLSNNQLESVTGLEKLRKMQFLVLDNNNLSSVFKELGSLRRLEMLRCSSNNLRDVPRDVRGLRNLQDLDISNNRIVVLPTDIFLLPRLECFNASQNQVTKIPSFTVKVQNRHWISSVDLSDNQMAKFPGHLMNVAHKLDLSANQIRSLPWSTLKKVDWERDQELLLGSNPLSYPPEDVCQSGLKSILQFFQESQADVKTYQGVKVFVIGSHRSGKSSLIHSLVDQQARLADDVTETAAGIDAYEMSFDYDVKDGKPGKSLNLCLWDFCGDPFYLYPHYLFHEQPGITILTFSIPDYTPELFQLQVGSWFDWMIAKTNKLVVILVGTKADKVTPKKAQQVTKDVRDRLAAHLQRRHDMIQQRIKDIEKRPVVSPTLSEQLKAYMRLLLSRFTMQTDVDIEKRPVISPTLSEQLKAYMRLLQSRFTVQTDVLTTSCATFAGFQRLREAIEALAADRKLFPNVMRVIPTFWGEVETWVEEAGNAMVVPVMGWEDYSQEVTSRFGMKHLLASITQYLHESGKVLWFSNVASLKDMVFLRPTWLFDVLRQVFCHDPESLTFIPDETLKAIAFTPAKFERLKQELVAEGVVDRELLKGLLISLMPADVNKHSGQVLQILTQALEMGYPVSKRSRDRSYSFRTDKDSEGNPKIAKLLLPWFRTCPEPATCRQEWAELRDRQRLSVMYVFPAYMPPGLFELMTVRAYAEKYKLAFLAHWGGGVHARHTEEKVRLVVMYFREGNEPLGEESEYDGDEEEEEETEEENRPPSGGRRPPNRGSAPRGREDRPRSGHKDTASDSHPTSRLTRQDSMDSIESDDSDTYQTQGAGKRRSLFHLEQEVEMPETIQEMDEDAEEETHPSNSHHKGTKSSSKSDSKTAKGPKVSQCLLTNGSTPRRGEREEEGGASKRPTSRRRRRPTECGGDDDGSVVVRFEVRDNSEDAMDPTPASSMWTVLLPLLMEFEQLLQGYTGVLVERRTECPLCGEASFLGEWLTPKETQGMNTRTCEACNKHVDTNFLVQPREKKRDELMRDLIRRTVRSRRGAAVTSELDDIHRVAPPNPRRAALIPLDIGDDSLRRLLGHRDSMGSE